LLSIYHRHSNEKNDSFLSDELTSFLQNIKPELKQLLPEEIIIDYPGLFKEISRTSLDKFIRTQENELKLQEQLSVQDLQDNILTGYMSGLYMHFRNLYNIIHLDSYGNTIPITLEHKIANFYFIREFCYGSMFRYNSNGEFNIPYGGISYNSKNFKLKIEKIFHQETLELFKNTQIYSDDFETFLDKIQLTSTDFIFLDPPYDTDFSSYEGNEFNENDQVRLANTLAKIPAKFILIIKKTDFILSLYKDLSRIHIVDFDKQYAYNVRSRNNRDTNHLIISNFPV
jgi:DNA adenine methylase